VKRILQLTLLAALASWSATPANAQFLHRHPHHHHGWGATTGVAFYPVTQSFVTTPGVAFVPSTTISAFSYVPSSNLAFVPPTTVASFGCMGGFGGSTFSYVPSTNLAFVPSTAGFSTASFGCTGGAAGTSSIGSVVGDIGAVIDIIRRLRDTFPPPGDGGGGKVDSSVQTQLNTIKNKLNAMDKKLDALLKAQGLKATTQKSDATTPPKSKVFVTPGSESVSSVGMENGVTIEPIAPPTPIQAAAVAIHKAAEAADTAKQAYLAAAADFDQRSKLRTQESQVLDQMKKALARDTGFDTINKIRKIIEETI